MAVSATVTPGAVVSQTDQITVSLLNQIANPTVDISGSVGSLAIGSGAIYNSNINADAAMAYSKMESTVSGKMVVGNDSNESAIVSLSGDASLAYNTSTGNADLTIGANKITTAKILDANITTAKIADDSVTADKLADTSVSAGTYTLATVVVDDQGRITSASNGSAGLQTPRVQGFTSDGSWTAPTGVTRAKFTIVGGGGGGNIGISAGGSGATVIASVAVTAGTTYSITVGTGHAAGSAGYGGTSSVTVSGVDYEAGGGYSQTSSGDVGDGGTAGANGDIKINGRDGEASGLHVYFPETPAPIISGFGTGGYASKTGALKAAGTDGIVIVEWME